MKPSSKSIWVIVALLVLAALIGVFSNLQDQRRAGSEKDSEPTMRPSSPLLPAATSPAAANASEPPPPGASIAPAGAAPDPAGMLSLTLAFNAEGRLAVREREHVPNASVRTIRQIEGQTGLYHRIIAPDGSVVFENIVPDPRTLHWDTTDDGKHLRGGIATIKDAPLNLRLPAAASGRLEVYLVEDGTWTRGTIDKTGRLVGSFDL